MLNYQRLYFKIFKFDLVTSLCHYVMLLYTALLEPERIDYNIG